MKLIKVSDRSALAGVVIWADRYRRTRCQHVSPVARDFPVGPLAATLAVQPLATAAAYSIPAVAPAVARHLGVNPALIGLPSHRFDSTEPRTWCRRCTQSMRQFELAYSGNLSTRRACWNGVIS